MEKKGKRESNWQNKKTNERRYAEKNKMSHGMDEKWERKQYIKKCESNTIKDVIKIRLHMWNTKSNNKRNESDTTCTLCNTEENTTEHIMIYQEGNNTYNLLNKNKKD